MHEFCSHCDVRKTSLFEINQQLGDQMENLSRGDDFCSYGERRKEDGSLH